MKIVFCLLILTDFLRNLASSESIVYLGCYLKEPIRVNDPTGIQDQGQSTADLWFSTSPFQMTDAEISPQSCILACKQESFRYAGLSGGSRKDRCRCGSKYGSTGPGQCHPCRKDQPFAQDHCGDETSWSIYDTEFKVSSSPQKLTLTERSETTLHIRWDKPIAPNGPLTAYQISAQGLFSYSQNSAVMTNTKVWRVSEEEEEVTLTGLVPATKYNVSLVAINSGGQSVPTTATLWTKIGVPDTPQSPIILTSGSGHMTLQLARFENTKGPLTKYRIVMVDESSLFQTRVFTMDRVGTWNDSMTIGYPKYVAAQFSPTDFPSSGEFVIGDRKLYDGFFNGPIPEGHWYPSLGIVSTLNNFTEIAYSPTSHDQYRSDTDDPWMTSSTLRPRNKKRLSMISVPSDVVVMREMSPTVVTLWVTIAIMAAILLVCISIYSVLTFDLLPKRHRPPLLSPVSRTYTEERSTELTACAANPAYLFPDDLSGASYTHLGFVQDEDLKSRALDRLKRISNVPRSSVAIPSDDEDGVDFVGNGRFGPVHSSQLKSKDDQKDRVYLYSVRENFLKSQVGPEEEQRKFVENLDELVMLDPHVNVVKLVGFIDDGSSLVFVMEPYAMSLKDWLLDFRKSNLTTEMSPVTSYNLILCAMNIAEAMFHLNSFKVTHGELAAINVLVPSLQVPKVTGFGLLKYDPPRKKVYRDFRRWFAVEQFQNRCIKPCDIWSFGILLWEISCLGATPFHDVRNEDLGKRLGRGLRPGQVEVIGDPLYQLMLHCWQLDRSERPDFATLSCSLHQLLPNPKESLSLCPSFNYPPYIETFEYTSTY